MKLVTDVLDFNRGDHTYKEVCKGYTPGFGTSCTFLPHWMLLNLGVEFRNGTAAQLAVGVRVEARGTLSADGTMLQATRITFGD